MKWFKHYTEASNDNAINLLEQKHGYEGYGVYWKLLELCAAKYDGKTHTTFTFNKQRIRSTLRLSYKRLESIFKLGSECFLFTFKEENENYIFEFPKLAEIKDNHTRNLTVASKELASNLPLDKIRIDKKRRDKKRIKENIKEKLPINNSPLEVLNFDDPEIITWLREGSLPIQEKLLKKYDHDYLARTIEKAYYWQSENKKRQAGTFLSSWIERDNNKRLKGNLSEADYNLKALFDEAAAKIIPYDYGDDFKKNN